MENISKLIMKKVLLLLPSGLLTSELMELVPLMKQLQLQPHGFCKKEFITRSIVILFFIFAIPYITVFFFFGFKPYITAIESYSLILPFMHINIFICLIHNFLLHKLTKSSPLIYWQLERHAN